MANIYTKQAKDRMEEQKKLAAKSLGQKKPDKKIIISMSISPEDKERVQRYCDVNGCSFSGLLRKWIRENIPEDF